VAGVTGGRVGGQLRAILLCVLLVLAGGGRAAARAEPPPPGPLGVGGCGLPPSPLAAAPAERVWSAPGVRLTAHRHQDQAAYVLTARLRGGGRVDAGPLLAASVTTTRTVPELLEHSGALAAVNGDFFRIRASNAPLGPVVARGGDVRAATATPQPALVVQPDGIATLARVWVEQTVHAGPARLTPGAFNSPLLPPNGAAVLNRHWGSTPRHHLNPVQPAREVHVGADERVTAVHPHLTTSPIAEGGYVIVAQGLAAAELDGLRPGTRVRHDLRLRSDAPDGAHSAIGVGLPLLDQGRRAFTMPTPTAASVAPPPADRCAKHDPPVARTAVGIIDGGRSLLLVAVAKAPARPAPDAAAATAPPSRTDPDGDAAAAGEEGGAGGPRGLSVIDTAAFLHGLGATQAAMLDGGGSTAMAIRTPHGVRTIVRSSDPRPRPVPNAYALWPDAD
jgi:Phosphodiester glycosidase